MFRLFLYAAIQLIIHEDNNNGEIVLKSLVMRHGDFSEAYALLSVHYSALKMHEASYKMLQKGNYIFQWDNKFHVYNVVMNMKKGIYQID